jgi:hypothetical protein
VIFENTNPYFSKSIDTSVEIDNFNSYTYYLPKFKDDDFCANTVSFSFIEQKTGL